ncbi:MAG: SMP-30/gluconolactonase/LRE family protein [Conexibacter sp.]
MMVAGARIPLDRFEVLSEGLDHPEGICCTPDGTVYVGGEAGQLYRIEADGTATELLRTDGFLLGLAADGEGRIYAIDAVNRCVWQIDPLTAARTVFADGFAVPNWGAFAADGTYYLSDSGGWGDRDGLLWRIPPGGLPEVWTRATPNVPNGLALAADGKRLFLLESFPGAIVEIAIEADGSAGERVVLCELGEIVPDGVAVTVDGSLYIACYRPDAIYRWHPQEGLELVAADPRGQILAAPTNIAFAGPERDELLVPSIGRWHVARVRAGVQGIPLHYPTKAQLGR